VSSPRARRDARAVDLELRFMKLERFVDELSQVVAGQGRTIDALALESKRLRGLVLAKEEPDATDETEKPPHY
jgi:SlyX protein